MPRKTVKFVKAMGDGRDLPGNTGENKGHGHIFSRPDGVRMRCGGPKRCHSCQADKKRRDVPTVQAKKPTQVIVVKAAKLTKRALEVKAVPQDQVESAYTKLMNIVIHEMDYGVISRPQVNQIRQALKKILKVKG